VQRLCTIVRKPAVPALSSRHTLLPRCSSSKRRNSMADAQWQQRRDGTATTAFIELSGATTSGSKAAKLWLAGRRWTATPLIAKPVILPAIAARPLLEAHIAAESLVSTATREQHQHLPPVPAAHRSIRFPTLTAAHPVADVVTAIHIIMRHR
jgi:hypothetical protein